MEDLNINYEHCGFSKEELLKHKDELSEVLKLINHAIEWEYETDFASINLPFDNKMLEEVISLAKNYKEIKNLIIIGIGGSNLGAWAVQEAIQGSFNNKIKVYYVDTINPENIKYISEVIEKNKTKTLINVITKSGTTVETIANFSILSKLVNNNKNIVVTTDKDTKLWSLAEKKGYPRLEIPKKVGGRYSVFSSVGLFPLAVLGLNIKELLNGAKKMRDICIKKEILNNPASVCALALYLNYKQGYNICNNFIFEGELEVFGKWYKQLISESVSKERDVNNKLVHIGITPIVSIGSTDLHSMSQLFFGGPNDKFTFFVSVKEINTKLEVPKNKEFITLVPSIQGKDLSNILSSIEKGTKLAYTKNALPFIEIVLPKKDEFFIGQLLQLKMIEVIYLSYLLKVNPFDQPAVEQYKQETRRFLEK